MYALPQISFRDATNPCYEHDILGLFWVEDKCFRTLCPMILGLIVLVIFFSYWLLLVIFYFHLLL